MSEGVVCTRGGIEESRHVVHGVVVDGSGRRLAQVGEPGTVAFFRSAAKPIQALPVVDDGVAERFGLGEDELALCCASHNAEPRHLEVAASILRKAGLGPDDLECGPHPPMRDEVAAELYREGGEPRPIHNNCSGKHAGMLALAVARGWPTRGYVGASHPVQRRMLEEVCRWTELDEAAVGTGTDGCGVVSFAVPLERMARAFGRLAAAARSGDPGPRAVVGAMTGHPFLVAGTGRLCTALMERAGDRLFVKTGAEGVYCAGVPGRGLGVAVKVEDGARRASDVALLEILGEMELLDDDDLEALGTFHRPPVRNTRGERVGELRAAFDLRRG